ncbi:MAG: DEAD/DEAH box helicase [Actinobacteria bacterium]|nr:DEAD/DEAH box helicase [Actinomycetota bacterium]
MTGPGFALDPFQLDAIAALDDGLSVLVAAPTGSGKTVVADAAIDMALHSGGKAFYTTPIKALSNQKYSDLVARLGVERVGLLTGDTSINGEADVVVMTTEVLRNMIYAGSSTLDALHMVILDEVHYLQDAYRGPVWEEIIIELPAAVRLVCLSATVSNTAELGEWIATVRGPTATIIEHNRPVELENLYLVGDKTSPEDHLVPILVDGRPNPEGYRFDGGAKNARKSGGNRFGNRSGRFLTPKRIDVVERLQRENLLPAIYFIFSRNACDDALAHCRDAGMRFTDAAERERIRAILGEAIEGISDNDLEALGYDLWAEGLQAGIASHHAGLIPAFKEAVERCFIEGLIKVVFATETLALGVNMQARSVVIDKLSKYNGETHEFLTPAQYTQLTGRAGRRGIDTEGYAVVLYSPFVGFGQIATLASSREYPLTSSFRPTYNMSANLVRRMSRTEAMSLLGQSFGQYQADHAIVGLERRLARDRERLANLQKFLTCDCGGIADYADLQDRVAGERKHRPDGRSAIEQAAALLRPGAIIAPRLVEEAAEALDLGDTETFRLIVLSVAYRGKGSLRIRCVDEAGRPVTLSPDDLAEPPRAIITVDLPTPYAPSSAAFLDEAAELLAAHPLSAAPVAPAGPSRWERLVVRLEAHPVHRCPKRDRHLEAWKDSQNLERSIDKLERQLHRRGGSVARRFDAVCDVLNALDCIDGWQLTERGDRLRRIYHECDLLIALGLDDGVFDGLSAPELAAVVSSVIYEERRRDAGEVVFPNNTTRRRFGRMTRLASVVNKAETARGLPPMRAPDAGFMKLAHGWASGIELSTLIDGNDMSGGDFVRTIKLLVDLLSQLAEVAPDLTTRRSANDAVVAMRRGVVADAGPAAAAAAAEP